MKTTEETEALNGRADELSHQIVTPDAHPKDELKKSARAAAPVPAPTDAAPKLEPQRGAPAGALSADPPEQPELEAPHDAPDVSAPARDREAGDALRDAVSEIDAAAKERDQRVHQMALNALEDGTLESSSFIAPGFAANADRRVESPEEKRRKEDEKFTQAMLKKQLEEYLKWLDAQIAYWKEQERLWEERGDAIDEALARLDRGERIDVDQDGMARDTELRAAQDAYQQKYGRKLDLNDKDDLLKLQRFAREQAENAWRQAQDLERERQRAREAQTQLERNPHDPAARERARELLQTAEGQRQLGQAVANSENTAFRETAYTESTSTRQDQENAAEVSLTADEYFTNADSEDDAFSVGTSVAKAADPVGGNVQSLRPAFASAVSGEAAPAIDDPARALVASPGIPIRSV